MIVFSKIKNKDNNFDNSDVKFSIQNDDIALPELVYEFQQFLKACGYSFGDLEFTEE